MKWLIPAIFSFMVSLTPTHATEIAHTGEPCKTIQQLLKERSQTSKKEHPSQHIYYETINSKKCYHVHTVTTNQTEKDASVWVIPKGVSSFPRSSLNSSVLEYFMQPSMRGFYDNYTRGSPFGR